MNLAYISNHSCWSKAKPVKIGGLRWLQLTFRVTCAAMRQTRWRFRTPGDSSTYTLVWPSATLLRPNCTSTPCCNPGTPCSNLYYLARAVTSPAPDPVKAVAFGVVRCLSGHVRRIYWRDFNDPLAVWGDTFHASVTAIVCILCANCLFMIHDYLTHSKWSQMSFYGKYFRGPLSTRQKRFAAHSTSRNNFSTPTLTHENNGVL